LDSAKKTFGFLDTQLNPCFLGKHILPHKKAILGKTLFLATFVFLVVFCLFFLKQQTTSKPDTLWITLIGHACGNFQTRFFLTFECTAIATFFLFFAHTHTSTNKEKKFKFFCLGRFAQKTRANEQKF